MTCSVEGCDGTVRARALCSKHYSKWKTYGDPLAAKRPTYGTGRRIHTNGYVQIRVPGHPMASKQGYAMEHRVVLHDAGVEIPDGHHVHHVNGNKQDNRIENLEVLSATAHQLEHLAEGVVRNGHGIWPVLRDDKERFRRSNARAAAKRKVGAA